MSVEASPPSTSPEEATTTGATPASLAQAVIRSFLDARWDHLETLIHPDAELETGFSVPGSQFGRKQVLDAAWVARTTDAFRPEYQLVESLDAATALVGARLRFEIGDGLFTDRDAAYLMTFEDGLLRETRVFESEDAAIDAFRRRTAGDGR